MGVRTWWCCAKDIHFAQILTQVCRCAPSTGSAQVNDTPWKCKIVSSSSSHPYFPAGVQVSQRKFKYFRFFSTNPSSNKNTKNIKDTSIKHHQTGFTLVCCGGSLRNTFSTIFTDKWKIAPEDDLKLLDLLAMFFMLLLLLSSSRASSRIYRPFSGAHWDDNGPGMFRAYLGRVVCVLPDCGYCYRRRSNKGICNVIYIFYYVLRKSGWLFDHFETTYGSIHVCNVVAGKTLKTRSRYQLWARVISFTGLCGC